MEEGGLKVPKLAFYLYFYNLLFFQKKLLNKRCKEQNFVQGRSHSFLVLSTMRLLQNAEDNSFSQGHLSNTSQGCCMSPQE